MKILHLTLKKKWFNMIASGEKKEEYREDKMYWKNRLVKPDYWHSQTCKEFDIIRFRNGYAKDAPTMDVECKGIRLADPCEMNEAWYDKYYSARVFIISLGEVMLTMPENMINEQFKTGMK